MRIRANQFGWKAMAARLLLVPVLAGTAASAGFAQSVPPPSNTTGSAERARQLTVRANQAKQSGDLALAEKFAREAVALRADLKADEPRPENVLAEIAKLKSGGTTVAATAKPADPQALLAQAKAALAAGNYDAAAEFANQANAAATAKGVRWGLFDDTPATVLKAVQAKRGNMPTDKAKADQMFATAKKLATAPAKTDAERMANLEQAQQLAYQAKNLHGSYSFWDFGDKPDKLIGEVESAKATLRKKMPVVSQTAVATLPPPTLDGVKQAAGAKMADATAKMNATVTQAAGTATQMAGKATTAVTQAGSKATTTAALMADKATVAVNQTAQAVVSPAKAEVMKLVADGRASLAAGNVTEARAKAVAAREMAEKLNLTTAFGPAEDSPDRLFQGVQVKGRDAIETMTKNADVLVAQKKFPEAEAALANARQMSSDLGLYANGIVEKQAQLAAMTGKTMAAPVMPVASATPRPAMPAMPGAIQLPSGEMLVPAGPAVPVMPTLTPPPATLALAQPGAPLTGAQMLAQAESEMRKGDLTTAKTIAINAFNADPSAKDAAQAMLRTIDAEDLAMKRKTASQAFDNATAEFGSKRYDAAMGVFQLLDPSHLSGDQRVKLAEMTAACQKMKPAVTLAGGAQTADVVPGVADESKPGVAKIGGGGMAEQQRAMADVAYQKFRQEGFDAINGATAAWGKGQTDAALQRLADYAGKVKASSLSPSQQAMLLRPIDERTERFRIMKHTTDFMASEEKGKLDARRELVTANVAESQKQDEIKKKVRQINDLTKASKFKEAELAAAQLKQLDPDDPAVTYIAEQTKNRRRMEDFKGIRSDQEKFNLTQFNDAEKTGPAVTIDQPVAVNPERSRIAALRGEDGTYLRTRTPQETMIENRLDAPFSFKFENAKLSEVIVEIRTKTGLNITTDSAAIDDEKINLGEVSVTEEVKDVSLRDGLTILLSKARLAHVVENNVVKVTTEKRSKGRLKTKVYHVMDLVTPIPEFRPAEHHTLEGAMQAAKGTNVLGQIAAAAGGMGGGGGSVRVPTGGLQQGELVSGGQTGVPGGTTPFLSGAAGTMQNNQLQSTPVAMSPQRAAYADQLKKLITGMVRPYSWQGMAGPGNIEYYDIGGALVVNQTADVLREVQDLLESLRRLQDLSVSVEVRVISLSEAFFERVGVDFALNVKTHNTSFERQLATSSFAPEPFLNDINVNGAITGYNPAAGGFTSDLNFPIRSTSYGLSVPPFGGYQGALSPTNNGGLALGLAFLNDIQVYMFLEAAQGNRRVNVMQAPKVTLFNGQTSTVYVGDVAYFTTSLSVFNVGGQFVYLPINQAFPIGQGVNPNTGQQGGVSVTVQAVISADRRFVRLNLSPSLTALASATVPLFPISTFITPVFEGGSQGQPVPFTQFFQQPSFSEIVAQTTVAVPDGGTVLLGGLKTLAQSRSEFGPPVISQVPYLNRLFKNVGVGQETRHVMIMVTPRIIINSEEEARQVTEGSGLGGN